MVNRQTRLAALKRSEVASVDSPGYCWVQVLANRAWDNPGVGNVEGCLEDWAICGPGLRRGLKLAEMMVEWEALCLSVCL